MANRFNKIWSALDFWDKEENQSQKKQFAVEDERDRERRRRLASRASVARPGDIITPTENQEPEKPAFNPGGSQGEANKALEMLKPSTLQKAVPKQEERPIPAPSSLPKAPMADKIVNLKPKADVKRKVAVIKPGEGPKPDFKSDALAVPGVAAGTALSALRTTEGLVKGAIETPAMMARFGDWIGRKITGNKNPTGFVESLDKATQRATRPIDRMAEETDKAALAFGKGSEGVYRPAQVVENTALVVPALAAGGSALLTKANKAPRVAEVLSKVTDQGRRKTLTFDNLLKKAKGNSADEAISEGATAAEGASSVEQVVPGMRAAEDAPEIPGQTPKEKGPTETEVVEVAPGVKSTNIPKVTREKLDANDLPQPTQQLELLPEAPTVPRTVPDVTNPIALAKADPDAPAVAAPAENPQMADFSQAIKAPLQKAERVEPQAPVAQPTETQMLQQAQQGDLPMATDASGNPTLMSDAEYARKLEAAGLGTPRQASPVAATEEAMVKAAEDAARAEVNLEGKVAPRTGEQVLNNIEDDATRTRVAGSAEDVDPVDLAEVRERAAAAVNSRDDLQLIGDYSQPREIRNPEEYNIALNVIRRLQNSKEPGAVEAVTNAFNSMQKYTSDSGLGLRATQIAWDDMPSAMKQKYLIDKIEKSTGAELPDVERQRLLNSIDITDNATQTFRSKQDEMNKLLKDVSIGSPVEEGRIIQLANELDEARIVKERTAGDTLRMYKEYQANPSIGAQVGEAGRALMLSSPFGRIFDLMSTASTTASDLSSNTISSLIGKVLNKRKGAGTVIDALPNPGQLMKGTKEGFDDVRAATKGVDRVEDFIGAEKRATRGDVQGDGRLSKIVRPFVEAPTNLTRGLEKDKLLALGRQEGQKLGLKGQALDDYALGRSAVPTDAQLAVAKDVHMRANMLHENPVSRGLNSIARQLDANGKASWLTPIIRNQVAPFTSWLGGNFHRAVTDKNILWNVGSAVRNARRGDVQGMVDDMGRVVTNAGEAFTLGYLLTSAGVISDTDANGDSYGGLYFHIGDRYIPIAASGTMSVPIILGNSVHKGLNSDGDFMDGLTRFAANGLSNSIGNLGVASVLGGENNLQAAVSGVVDELRKPADERSLDPALSYAGNMGRQYIPALTGDINSGLDMLNMLNPTGEAPETRITEEGSNKTDTIATEIAKTKARLPFASQTLDRRVDVAAKDPLDRITKGTRETDGQAIERKQDTSLKGLEKTLKAEKISTKMEDVDGLLADGEFDKAIKGYQYQLKKAEADETASETSKNKIRDKIQRAKLQSEGVPTDKDSIQAVIEDGDYDSALKGMKYELSTLKNDKSKAKSVVKKQEDAIKRIEVTRDLDYPPKIIEMYSKMSNSEWRKLGDPDGEDHNEDLYQMLWRYDEALAKAGVSGSDFKPDKQKYSAPKGGSGGKGGRGGSGSKKLSANIATIGKEISTAPQKYLSADFARPKSAIPIIDKVPNNDTSKLKKITVSRGGRS